jgi:hypothetical protein
VRAIAEHTSAVESLNALAPSLTLHRQRPDIERLEARLARALDGLASGERPSQGDRRLSEGRRA